MVLCLLGNPEILYSILSITWRGIIKKISGKYSEMSASDNERAKRNHEETIKLT